MTTQRTITLTADQWDAILDGVLDAVASHHDEGAFGEGWTRSRLSAASAALSSALAEPEPEAPTDEELLKLAGEWDSGCESIEFEFIAEYAKEVLQRWGAS